MISRIPWTIVVIALLSASCLIAAPIPASQPTTQLAPDRGFRVTMRMSDAQIAQLDPTMRSMLGRREAVERQLETLRRMPGHLDPAIVDLERTLRLLEENIARYGDALRKQFQFQFPLPIQPELPRNREEMKRIDELPRIPERPRTPDGRAYLYLLKA